MKEILLPYLVLLVFIQPVLAHLPHDEVYFVATPEDGSGNGPWISHHYDAATLSFDGGQRWQNIGGDVFLLEGHEGFTLTDDTVVVCGSGSVWYTGDFGANWSEVAIAGQIADCVMKNNEIVVATDQGLLFGEYDGALTILDGGEYASVDWSGDWITAASSIGGTVFYGEIGEKGQVIAGPNVDVSATTMMDDPPVLFAGDKNGSVWTLVGGVWTACAPVPPMARPAIMHMGVFGESLVALPANQGPYRTNRGCTGWEDRRTPEVTEFLPASGGAVSDEAAFTTMRLGEEAWLVAGWAGIYASEDQGVTWRESWVGATDRTMAVSYHPEFPDNPRIWTATYASGVAYTDDFGETFQSPSFGVPRGNIQFLTSVPDSDGLVFATDNWDLISSTDNGESWVKHDDPFGQLLSLEAFSVDDIWLIAKYDEEEFATRIAYSSDGGAIWNPVYLDEDDLGVVNRVVRFPAKDGERYCVSGDLGVACADDRDKTWAMKNNYDSPERATGAFAVWPEEVSPVVAYGTERGIYSSSDSGETWVLSFEAGVDEIVNVSVSPQGFGLALTRTGDLLASNDGLKWTETAVNIGAWGYTINFRPDALGMNEALVGTSTGVIRLLEQDGNWTAEPFGSYQSIDSLSTYVDCHDCAGADESSDEAWMSHAYRVGSGVEMQMYITGSTLKIRGSSDVDSVAIVSLENLGLEYEIGGVDSKGYGELLVIDGLEDRTHLITIEHLAGEGVLFDAIEAYGYGVTLFDKTMPVTETGETAETGETTRPETGETSLAGETDVTNTDVNDSCGCEHQNNKTGLLWLGLIAVVIMVRRKSNSRYA